MKHKLLTGLSLASVAGTGGVAFAGVLRPPSNAHSVSTAQALTTAADASAIGLANPTSNPTSTSTSTTPIGRSVIYQVGDAGWVTVDVMPASIALRSTLPKSGWTVVAATAHGTHVNVQFTDTRRIVGVDVGLVDSAVTVSATNDLVDGSVSSIAAPVVSATDGVQSTAPPPFDVPVATPPPALVDAPAVTASASAHVPARSATTATSAAGGSSGGTSARGAGHDGASGGENDD